MNKIRNYLYLRLLFKMSKLNSSYMLRRFKYNSVYWISCLFYVFPIPQRITQALLVTG